jgi:hypothetical protein
MIRDIALKKFEKLNDGSFVPYKGVTIRHKDASTLTLTWAFVEKYRGNEVDYIIVYTKNHGFFIYQADEIDSIYEFNIAIPTTLLHMEAKSGILDRVKRLMGLIG